MAVFNPSATYIATRTERCGIGPRDYQLTAGEAIPSGADAWDVEVIQSMLDGHLVAEEVGPEGLPTINPDVSYIAVRGELIGIGPFNIRLEPGTVCDDFAPEVLEVLIANQHVVTSEKVVTTATVPEAPAPEPAPTPDPVPAEAPAPA